MQWSEVRNSHPKNQWMVLEVIQSHMDGTRHVLDDVSIVELCGDSALAFEAYRRLKRRYPGREFLFMCTDREELEIEVHWVGGLRRVHETDS